MVSANSLCWDFYHHILRVLLATRELRLLLSIQTPPLPLSRVISVRATPPSIEGAVLPSWHTRHPIVVSLHCAVSVIDLFLINIANTMTINYNISLLAHSMITLLLNF